MYVDFPLCRRTKTGHCCHGVGDILFRILVWTLYFAQFIGLPPLLTMIWSARQYGCDTKSKGRQDVDTPFISGRYLVLSLLLIGLSFVLTTLVINLHYRKPSSHTMPSWVRRVFIKTLPGMLLMKVPIQVIKDSMKSRRSKFLRQSDPALKSLQGAANLRSQCSQIPIQSLNPPISHFYRRRGRRVKRWTVIHWSHVDDIINMFSLSSNCTVICRLQPLKVFWPMDPLGTP